jgi:AcrR family transcriptional regulator
MGRPKGSGSDAAERLVVAAGRGFRRRGYGGAGVDGIARSAGLTSGAFYAHFGSKAQVFRRVVACGLELLSGAVGELQARHGRRWRVAFIDFYLGERLDLGLDGPARSRR